MGDGVTLAATLYAPDGSPPAAGWPAVLVLHSLGESRADVQEIAETYLAPNGYAVLTIDSRGHGQSGGQASLAGPRDVADYAAALSWLRARPGVNDSKIGAVGVSLGGGILWKLLTASGHAARGRRPDRLLDEPVGCAAAAGVRQERARHLLQEPVAAGALGPRDHHAHRRRARRPQPAAAAGGCACPLGAERPREDPHSRFHDPRPPRLRVRHGAGAERLRAAPRAEAALPRRPGPCTRAEPRGGARLLPDAGPPLARQVSEGLPADPLRGAEGIRRAGARPVDGQDHVLPRSAAAARAQAAIPGPQDDRLERRRLPLDRGDEAAERDLRDTARRGERQLDHSMAAPRRSALRGDAERRGDRRQPGRCADSDALRAVTGS